MAARRRKSEQQGSSEPMRVLRRRADSTPGLRKLPSDLQDLAAGRREVLRPRRRPKGKITDSRIAGLIAGVANHEARRVYDVRCERLRQALAENLEPALGSQLCEAQLLGLWRARSVMGFDALAQDIVGIPFERARALAQQAASERGISAEQLPDIAVALWIRSEAALLDHCPEASVGLSIIEGGQLQLCVRLPLAPPARAALAVAAIGRSAGGLARVLEGSDPRMRDRPRES